MRTTVKLDRDVEAAVERLRRAHGLGLSAALNELVRRGLAERPPSEPFEQRSSPMGALIDVADVADALEQLEGPQAR